MKLKAFSRFSLIIWPLSVAWPSIFPFVGEKRSIVEANIQSTADRLLITLIKVFYLHYLIKAGKA